MRLLRHVMGGLASAAIVGAVYLHAAIGLVEHRVAHAFAAMVLLTVFAFTACFMSGFNRRFSDPSLTLAQMAASGLSLAYLAFASGPFAALQIPFYMMALLFGAFRLTTRQQIAISGYFVVTYAGARFLSDRLGLGSQGAGAQPAWLIGAMHLALMLLPMSLIGGHVNFYRTRLRASNRELNDALEKIERIATYDELTGLYSRRIIAEIAAKELKRSDRSGASLCIAMIDADHFKRFNDLYGHSGGDNVLRTISRTLQRTLRATEYVGRYGGEEFMVVLAETPQEHAAVPLERFRREMGATPIDGLPAHERVTVSIGVAVYRKGEPLRTLVERADAALYEAKRSGRDRIAWSPGPD